MAPLIILVAVTAALRFAGARRWLTVPSLAAALRGGLAAMFLVTGGSHFIGMREAMIAMVPPSLPSPETLVTITGVLEILGAIGLLWRRTTQHAAVALGVMLIGMYPANVYAATHGLQTEWLDNLIPRTVLQLVFLAAAIVVAHGFWSTEQHHDDGPQHDTPAGGRAATRPTTAATTRRGG